MALAEVKPIREDNAALTDIPAMLRNLAKLIEDGEIKKVTQVVVIRDGEDDEPAIHGYGNMGRLENALVLIMRAQGSIVRMLNNGGITR